MIGNDLLELRRMKEHQHFLLSEAEQARFARVAVGTLRLHRPGRLSALSRWLRMAGQRVETALAAGNQLIHRLDPLHRLRH